MSHTKKHTSFILAHLSYEQWISAFNKSMLLLGEQPKNIMKTPNQRENLAAVSLASASDLIVCVARSAIAPAIALENDKLQYRGGKFIACCPLYLWFFGVFIMSSPVK